MLVFDLNVYISLKITKSPGHRFEGDVSDGMLTFSVLEKFQPGRDHTKDI